MKKFLIDQTPGALYASKAIIEMLERDQEQGDSSAILLFRKLSTGREATSNESRRYLHQELLEAGVDTSGM